MQFIKIHLTKNTRAADTSVSVTTIKSLSAKNGSHLENLIANFARLKHQLLITDDVAHARYCLDKATCHFFLRKVCPKNRFHARDIAGATILDETSVL